MVPAADSQPQLKWRVWQRLRGCTLHERARVNRASAGLTLSSNARWEPGRGIQSPSSALANWMK